MAKKTKVNTAELIQRCVNDMNRILRKLEEHRLRLEILELERKVVLNIPKERDIKEMIKVIVDENMDKLKPLIMQLPKAQHIKEYVDSQINKNVVISEIENYIDDKLSNIDVDEEIRNQIDNKLKNVNPFENPYDSSQIEINTNNIRNIQTELENMKQTLNDVANVSKHLLEKG